MTPDASLPPLAEELETLRQWADAGEHMSAHHARRLIAAYSALNAEMERLQELERPWNFVNEDGTCAYCGADVPDAPKGHDPLSLPDVP